MKSFWLVSLVRMPGAGTSSTGVLGGAVGIVDRVVTADVDDDLRVGEQSVGVEDPVAEEGKSEDEVRGPACT